MALPWQIPLECAPASKSKGTPPEPTFLKHFANLNLHENPCEELQTGLVCDIGVNNREPNVIQRLIASGMTVARLDARDLEPDACTQLIQSIRQAVYNYSAELEYIYPLAVILDVKGPDIVTGDLKGGPRSAVELVQYGTIRLTTDTSWRESGTADCLYFEYDHLTELNPGDIVYIDSLSPEKIKLTIEEVGDDSIECSIDVGGIVGPKMTVRIAHVPQESDARSGQGDSLQSVSCSERSEECFDQMQQQIAWAVASDVDGLLVPNAQGGNDIRQIRNLLGDKGKHILVFACIDSILGFDNIGEILSEADGIYVDRGVLCTDLPVEKIFIAQKIILAKCNEIGKPCLFKAVINEQIPTLCVTDIANLVFDGVDALCLEIHYDSPMKKFAPNYDAIRMAEHCIAAAGVICRHAERVIYKPRIYGNVELMESPLPEPTTSICVSAVELAMRSNASVIICVTNSGRTAKILCHVKPACPIIAVTRACHTARQLRFWRGVRALHYYEAAKGNWAAETDARIHTALDFCKAKRILRAGDAYITVAGSRRATGYCDSVRLLYASARATVTLE